MKPSVVKCAHCRRPAKRKTAVRAKDGSTLVSCRCGLQWIKRNHPIGQEKRA